MPNFEKNIKHLLKKNLGAKFLSSLISFFIITPDRSRDSAYKVNSKIAIIVKEYGNKLIPISCAFAHYISLKLSWEKLTIPILFSIIYVIVGAQILLTNDYELNDRLPGTGLIEITSKADNMVIYR